MTDETKSVLLELKVLYEVEAAKARKEANEAWRPHSQTSRAQATNATYLWCANEIDKMLVGQMKQVCLYCKKVVQEGYTLKGLASHVVCPDCKERAEKEMGINGAGV